MSNIIAFPGKPQPTITGGARCVHCEHEWVGVAPLGTSVLECPECHSMKGLFVWPVERPEIAFKCLCGSMLFYLSPDSTSCYQCGVPAQE